MINVAIVEDEDCAANNLSEYLNTFGRQNNTEIKAERFRDAISLLTGYSGKFDIVFMDIELPEMNGMDAAKKLREIDMSVTLVFVTNMAQYAVKGYEVGAVDYIVKPVSYYDFSLKLRRILYRSRFSSARVQKTAARFLQSIPPFWCTQWESNPHLRLRRPTVYPLSYGCAIPGETYKVYYFARAKSRILRCGGRFIRRCGMRKTNTLQK